MKKTTFNRNGKSVTLDMEYTCDPNMVDPFTGEKGMEYCTQPQMRTFFKNVREAWRNKFGEEMPPRNKNKVSERLIMEGDKFLFPDKA